MEIAIIGASGYTGSRILAEALDRGHAVTAIVRDVERLPDRPGLTGVRCDVSDQARLGSLLALLTDHPVTVSAFNPGKDTTGRGTAAIVAAAKQAGTRLVVVGGAGSLEVAPGRRLVEEPDFPAAWKDGAIRTAAFLDALRAEPDLDWTFVSPAARLVPGQRTGSYRIGGDRLLTDANGDSRISLEDYAVAMLDEIERPRHRRMRFSVAG